MKQRLTSALHHITRHDLSALAALLMLALLLWTLAYQMPFSLRLHIGGNTETHRREDDAPFLHGFNASEPASDEQWRWWLLEPGYGYRWTKNTATVHLPGIGGGKWLVTLFAGSGRPGAEHAVSTWQVGERTLPPVSLPPPARKYHVLAAADTAGNLTIHMHTPPYQSPGDPRDLGFVLREVRVEPAVHSLRMPALAQPGWLAISLTLLYSLTRWLGLALRPALLTGLAYVVVLAVLLAQQRMAITLFTPTLAGLTAGCWGLALLAGLLIGRWRTEPLPWRTAHMLAPAAPFGAIIGLTLLAFALRAGGMLHPHAIFSDHLLNANNLLQLGLGDVYFTEGLPDTRGGGDAPYPPGLYVLLAPALTLFPTDMHSRALLIQIGIALLDSLVLMLLWYLLRRAGLGQRAALAGAALYLLPPPIMASFSIGEYANLGGQVLALPVLALLTLGQTNTPPPLPHSALFCILLCLGLLGHLGVAILLTLVMLAAWGLSISTRRTRKGRFSTALRSTLFASPAVLTIGGIFAAALATIFYYSAPEFAAIYTQRMAGDTAASLPTDHSLITALRHTITGLFTPGSRLLPLTAATGLIGLLLLWQRPAHQPQPATFNSFRLTLLAWWLGTLLSSGLLLIAREGVRWQHFLYPALCLGGGVTLAALWRRGRAGRIAALISLLTIISHGLTLWVWQVYDYLH